MPTKTQIGSVTVSAYQWMANSTLHALHVACPWARSMPFNTSGDGSLNVPATYGATMAFPTDWIYRTSDGTVDVMKNAPFVLLYTATTWPGAGAAGAVGNVIAGF